MDLEKTIEDAVAKGVQRYLQPSSGTSSPLRLGAKVFIRTVTFYYTGQVVGLSDHEVVLGRASWIADTGPFGKAMANGSFSEVEPYPDDTRVTVMRGSIVDVSDWKHDLPRKQV